MKSQEIRQNWLNYFESELGHLVLPSASLIPDNPTLLLTNAGMVPFVPYFLGKQKPPSNRITTVQKCVRVGGKDSDLENIGKTSRHLTFFEMLGNFSFGDYFKEEIIPWSWNLLTKVYGFKPDELIVSVFAGDEKVAFDEKAYQLWHKKLGVPESRILKLGQADNFWGPPGGISGPCGPCSEIYYAPPDGSEPIEIWNLVFMQYEQFENGSLQNLTKPNIDTGAGLERLATILQNKKSVYETDLMSPIIDSIQNLPFDKDHEKAPLALKIIADHLRCSAMLLADGVKSSNLGRGYILRMLIRRAGRYGKLIGLSEPFLYNLLPSVGEVFAGAYPELNNNFYQIQTEIQAEEVAFNQTIERGLKKFNEIISTSDKIINGESAFELYATFGFPLELTIDLAEEHGLTVDLQEYEKAKNKHSEISNQNKFAVGFQAERNEELKDLPNTQFLYKNSSELYGFGEKDIDHSSHADYYGQVLYIDENKIVLNKTLFYAESGGQLADKGILYKGSPENYEKAFEVEDVQKFHNIFIHSGKLLSENIQKGDYLFCDIDKNRRKALEQHHTATHLLHAALRLVTNNTAQQKGSMVSPDRLRFDFSSAKPLDKDILIQIQYLINEIIRKGALVQTEILSFDEAIEKGALAFFDDKYESEVRVLIIDTPGQSLESNGLVEDSFIDNFINNFIPNNINSSEKFSIELCGGTHIQNTREIGQFKIISESAISSGIRRIEALAGQACLNYLREGDFELEEIKDLLKTPRGEIIERVKSIQEENKNTQKQIIELEKQIAELKANELLNQIQTKNNIKVLITETNLHSLKEALEYMGNKLQNNYLLFLINSYTSKPSYAIKISPDLKNKYSAKEILSKFSGLIGGSGGGKADYAQGGGGEINKIQTAIESIKNFLNNS